MVQPQPIVHSLINADIGGFKPIVDYPGDDCCFIYDEHNFDYRGNREPNHNIDDRRKQICHNGSRTEYDLHPMGWGDKLGSYICGKNVWFDFCKDGLSSCHNGDNVNSGAGHTRNYAVRHMDSRASYVVMGPYDPRQIGAVTLFEDNDCSGASGRFYWDPETASSGTYYNYEDMYYGGMRNNSMHSFMVPKGYTVELYDGHGFTGDSQIVDGDFLNDSEQMRCVPAKFGDRVSSLIVKRQP